MTFKEYILEDAREDVASLFELPVGKFLDFAMIDEVIAEPRKLTRIRIDGQLGFWDDYRDENRAEWRMEAGKVLNTLPQGPEQVKLFEVIADKLEDELKKFGIIKKKMRRSSMDYRVAKWEEKVGDYRYKIQFSFPSRKSYFHLLMTKEVK